MPSVGVKKERLEGLKRSPIIFLRLEEEAVYGNGSYHVFKWWKSQDEGINCTIGADKFCRDDGFHSLVVVDLTDLTEVEGQDIVNLEVRSCSPEYSSDWSYVLNALLLGDNSCYDHYPYLELLWFLRNRSWTVTQFIGALDKFEDSAREHILGWVGAISLCLQVRKQVLIKEVLKKFGREYDIYDPKELATALMVVRSDMKIKDHGDLFEKVDDLFPRDMQDESYRGSANPVGNEYLKIVYWFEHEEYALDDYVKMADYSALFSEQRRFRMVCRYFHDVRNGVCTLDEEVLKHFKEPKWTNLIRYRYCLRHPGGNVDLSVPLLVDSIITAKHSGGQKFQDFNGIMDLAISQSDVKYPKIDFGMEKLFISCNGAVTINEEFEGMIDYRLIGHLDEQKLSDKQFLYPLMYRWLDRYASRDRYDYCKFEKKDSNERIDVSQCYFKKKAKDSNGNEYVKLVRPDCIGSALYDDRWTLTDMGEGYQVLAMFVRFKTQVTNETKRIGICWDDVHMEDFRNNAMIYFDGKVKRDSEGNFVVGSMNTGFLREFIDAFFVPERMHIIQDKKVCLGYGDYFGLGEDNEFDRRDLNKKEAEILSEKVHRSLVDELGESSFNGDFFDLPFDKVMLQRLKSIFHYREHIGNSSPENLEYLSHAKGYRHRICAPDFGNTPDPPTGLLYFWCLGKECFFSSLAGATIARCKDWRDYKIYHLLEIIGITLLEEKENGFAPKESVKEFIAALQRVRRVFVRMRCKSCNHMLVSTMASGYNRYNNFKCINGSCDMYGRKVYLSYCHNCKSGLIDSREEAQCPNGWYICPSCLACCDDAQYERMASRYYREHLPVPERIQSKLGQGHNDKNIYYCPQCGNKLEFITPEEGESFIGCANCRKRFNF